MKIALVTYQQYPELSQSDSLLVAPLAARGATAEAAAWDSSDVDWCGYDLVVLRSCWDYQNRPVEFADWLDRLEREQVNLWNPARAVRWNIDKAYLRALAHEGVPTIPTVWLEQGQAANLESILAAQGWPRAVVKPRIGASAREIWVTSHETARQDQQRLDEALVQKGWLVQKLVEEIAQGEWSLIFFRGQFSHAVLKKPAPDNIFVQARLGGGWQPAYASEQLRGEAAVALASATRLAGVSEPLLYARVDGIVVEGQLRLMEMEINEPGLLLDADPPGAAERFADAMIRVSGA